MRLARSLIMVALVSAWILPKWTYAPPARADEPVTVTTVTIVVLVGGGIIGGATALYRWAFSEEEGTKVRVRIYRDADGNELRREYEEIPESPARFQIPADTGDFPPTPGYSMSESLVLDARDDGSLLFQSQDQDFRASVLDSGGDYIAFEAERLATTTFLKPPNAKDPAGSVSKLFVDIKVENLQLGTTDVPDTDGSSHYALQINSPQLGEVFGASARVSQAGPLNQDGDIPRSSYSARAGNTTMTFEKSLERVIPREIDRLQLEIMLSNGGDGVKRSRHAPMQVTTPIALAVVAIILSLLAVVLAMRRRRA